MAQGPLRDLRVVEFAGLAPTSFCAMLFSDLGADVVRIDRPGGNRGGAPLPGSEFDIVARGRRSIALDLKTPEGVETALKLVEKSDALIEGFRPGVMERLGLGPEAALLRNPRIAYGRLTGWGQSGPLAQSAGHDLNYIAISGALHAIGPAEAPVPPLTIVGDFAGGSTYLTFGLLAAVMHARAAGAGQVVDCAMSDGAASLLAITYTMLASGEWVDARQANIADGGAHFYGTYRCSDDKWIAVTAIEPQFYEVLLCRMGLEGQASAEQYDRSQWPRLRETFAAIFAQKSQKEWCDRMDGFEACFAPVLNLADAPKHPHNVARAAYVEVGGLIQPAPTPRFSLTPGAIQGKAPRNGADGDAILKDWGISADL